MKILNNLSGWIADLQPRERVVVSIGAALLVIAASIHVACCLPCRRTPNLTQRQISLTEDIQWLRDQSDVVSRLDRTCASQQIQAGEKSEVITRIVRRNQLTLRGIDQVDESLFSFTVTSSSPNRVLQLIQSVELSGFGSRDCSYRSFSRRESWLHRRYRGDLCRLKHSN